MQNMKDETLTSTCGLDSRTKVTNDFVCDENSDNVSKKEGFIPDEMDKRAYSMKHIKLNRNMRGACLHTICKCGEYRTAGTGGLCLCGHYWYVHVLL